MSDLVSTVNSIVLHSNLYSYNTSKIKIVSCIIILSIPLI